MPPQAVKSDFGTIAELWPAHYLGKPTSLLASELQERYRTAVEMLSTLPIGTGLEIGCGAGEFSIAAASLGHTVSGFDQSADMIAAANAQRPPAGALSFHVATVTDFVYPLVAIDWVAALGVIEWLDEPERNGVLEHCRTIVKPGGSVILSIPNKNAPARGIDSLVRRCWRGLKSAFGITRAQDAWQWSSFDPDAFLETWKAAGFTLTRMVGVNFLPHAADKVFPRLAAWLFRFSPSTTQETTAKQSAATLVLQFRRL